MSVEHGDCFINFNEPSGPRTFKLCTREVLGYFCTTKLTPAELIQLWFAQKLCDEVLQPLNDDYSN